MEVLRSLEERIVTLIQLVKQLKIKNEALQTECEHLKAESHELKTENAKLAEENGQLVARLEVLEIKGNDQIKETKIVVDDLIKSIDALVRNEHQS